MEHATMTWSGRNQTAHLRAGFTGAAPVMETIPALDGWIPAAVAAVD